MSKTEIVVISAMIYIGTSMLIGAGVDVWKIYENRAVVARIEAAQARLEAMPD